MKTTIEILLKLILALMLLFSFKCVSIYTHEQETDIRCFDWMSPVDIDDLQTQEQVRIAFKKCQGD